MKLLFCKQLKCSAASVSCMDAASRQKWEDFVSECCEELTTKNEQLWQRFSLAT